MKIAVVGSRSFNDYEYLKEKLNDFMFSFMIFYCTIVSGGAKGADSLAAKFAKEEGWGLEEYLPDWDKYGKSAGYKRNIEIVNACNKLIAFWDGESKGTKHSIDSAVKQNKPVYIYTDWKGNNG
jgi:hypothetical protein